MQREEKVWRLNQRSGRGGGLPQEAKEEQVLRWKENGKCDDVSEARKENI